jgi:hypothetical protein
MKTKLTKIKNLIKDKINSLKKEKSSGKNDSIGSSGSIILTEYFCIDTNQSSNTIKQEEIGANKPRIIEKCEPYLCLSTYQSCKDKPTSYSKPISYRTVRLVAGGGCGGVSYAGVTSGGCGGGSYGGVVNMYCGETFSREQSK